MGCDEKRQKAIDELEAMFSEDWKPSDEFGEVQVGANAMIRIGLSRSECRVLRRRNFTRLARFARNVCAEPERFRQRWLKAG